ncbi:MAG TPA: hypothetical protein VFI08_15650 [Spirochaetia bacterium]|nr:hypothetical protein [Spirochaetia bacterium]
MKAIFLLLNVVLAVAFLVIFFTPLFLVGGDWFAVFWTRNWPIAVVFVVTLAVIDTYFLLNWRLFTALEKEDWPTVASFLEERVLRRGRLTSSRVRLLLNTYLVTSNTDAILALEAFLQERRPALIGTFSLPFGIPHLLARDQKDSPAWFRALLQRPSLRARDWVRWNLAFCLLQAQAKDEAQQELVDLVDHVQDPVLLLLSIYLLEAVARRDSQPHTRVMARREELRRAHTPATLQAAVEKSSANIQVVVLSRLLRDAMEWLFAETASASGGASSPSGPTVGGPSAQTVH